MLLATAIGAAVYFDFELVTRRLRSLNIILWSLVAFVLISTIGFFTMGSYVLAPMKLELL